jgi:hypothetical protein
MHIKKLLGLLVGLIFFTLIIRLHAANDRKDIIVNPGIPAETTAELTPPAQPVFSRQPIQIQNEDFQKVKNVVESYGNTVSVFYKDMTDGETYFYNNDSQYYIASMIKTPFAMYIYRLALSGGVDINEKIKYREADKRESVGIGGAEYDTEFDIEELIGYSIKHSDNTAYQMLVRRFGYANFQKYFNDLGLKNMAAGLRGMTTIGQISFCLEKIYEFIEENNKYSNNLKQYMLDTDVKLSAFDGIVGRKYGYDESYLNEMCIVYDENDESGENRAYLFVLLTNGHQYSYNDVFVNIPKAFSEYNDSKKR